MYFSDYNINIQLNIINVKKLLEYENISIERKYCV